MNEIVQKEEIVKIINDKLVIDTGTDWTAIIALVFSILSTIGILWWQNYLRKKDKEEQAQIRESDKREKQIRIKKEDAIRQWNALYPHKLQFFTDFYDTLFRFVNYTGSSIERLRTNSIRGTEKILDNTIRPSDILEFCSLFNKFDEEAKILFDSEIQTDTHRIYRLIYDFVNNPIPDKDKSLNEYRAILDNNMRFPDYEKIVEQLQNVQLQIKDLKLEEELRRKFKNSLECKEFEE